MDEIAQEERNAVENSKENIPPNFPIMMPVPQPVDLMGLAFPCPKVKVESCKFKYKTPSTDVCLLCFLTKSFFSFF